MQTLIRLSAVLDRTGLSRSAVYDLTQRGEFPQQIKLSKDGRAVAWVEAEVSDWIQSRIAASRGAGTKAGAA
jgi:prophage regulatory protein